LSSSIAELIKCNRIIESIELEKKKFPFKTKKMRRNSSTTMRTPMPLLPTTMAMMKMKYLVLLLALVTLVCGSVDPDVKRNFTEIIEAKGYPCETHHVVTEDGYILTVFRIPYGKDGPQQRPRPPVFLQHGLLDSSFTWIVNEPYESLSYILADAG